jgi:hypothetical protein
MFHLAEHALCGLIEPIRPLWSGMNFGHPALSVVFSLNVLDLADRSAIPPEAILI